MEFDKSKVFTVFNSDELKVGSKGYFADFKEDLISRVQTEDKEYYLTIKRIETVNDFSFRIDSGGFYRYFYLVEEPKEKTKRPCNRDELIEMLKQQGLQMLIEKASGNIYTIISIETLVCIRAFWNNNVNLTYQSLCEKYTLIDGTELWVEE